MSAIDSRLRCRIAVVLLCAIAPICHAQIASDTLHCAPSFYKSTDYTFRPTQLIAPAAMLTIGVVGIYTFAGFKHSVNSHIAGSRQLRLDTPLQYAPMAVYLGLGFIPKIDTRSHDWRSRIMAGATAYILMAATTNLLKHTLREPRPYSGLPNSFPSGHTATAFTGAELLRIEYGPWIGAAGYVVASAIGFMRIYNNRHWLNDVIGGAAIGILSARAAYWLLPLERRLLGLDKRKSSESSFYIMPAGAGLAFSYTF